MGEAGRNLWTRGGRVAPALTLIALAGLLLPLVLHLAPPGGRGIAGAAFAAMAVAAAAGMQRLYEHERAGLANAITLLRAALAAAVLGWALRGEDAGHGLALLAGAALALDGCDGPAARRAGLASRFGFWFDMEVDAALTLALALFAWMAGKAGAWLLLIAVAHPAFLLAGLALPWLRRPLAESRRRKAVCVAQVAVLVVLALPQIGPPLSGVLAAGGLALVAWSFAVDIRWLARRR